MHRAFGWLAKALIVVVCLAYQFSVYSAMQGGGAGGLYAVLLWAPLALLAAWVVARSRKKPAWATGLLAAGAVIYLAEQQGRLGLAALSGLGHAACYFFMLWYFGRTLARGREPLVTRFARSLHGDLSAPMAAFTRGVTVAWCVFFAGQLIVSAILFTAAPLHAWSLFVNVLNLPLLVLMFVGQFAYRSFRHPDFPRASPWQALQAFSRDASLSKRAEIS
jgi:uncharacterized membrane protein